MWKNLAISTICLGIWGCVGGLDIFKDSMECVALHIDKANTYYLHEYYSTIIVNTEVPVENVRIFTNEQIKELVGDALKNKPLNSKGLLDISMTANELIENKIAIHEAKMLFHRDMIENYVKLIEKAIKN